MTESTAQMMKDKLMKRTQLRCATFADVPGLATLVLVVGILQITSESKVPSLIHYLVLSSKQK